MVAKPFVVTPRDYASPLNVVGEHITVLASGEATQGYEVFLQRGPEGSGPPPHSHPWDESFFVTKGQIDFGIGAESTTALPGTLVHLPAGTEHWFRFGKGGGEMVSMTSRLGASKIPGDRPNESRLGKASRSLRAPWPESRGVTGQPNATVSTERLLSASPQENTFERFEFKPGGQWIFVMHGPNGANYPNESVFREIEPDTKIVIEHIVKPRFKLTVTLTARGDNTHLAWVQEFESAEVAARMRRVSEPANEQNLDRLQSLLASIKR